MARVSLLKKDEFVGEHQRPAYCEWAEYSRRGETLDGAYRFKDSIRRRTICTDTTKMCKGAKIGGRFEAISCFIGDIYAEF